MGHAGSPTYGVGLDFDDVSILSYIVPIYKISKISCRNVVVAAILNDAPKFRHRSERV